MSEIRRSGGERTSNAEACVNEGGVLVDLKDNFHEAQLGSP